MSDDLSIPNPGFRGNRAGRYGTGPNRGKPGMDADTRRLVIFAGGLGALLVVLIGASALVGHRSTEIPVVTPDPRPIREKPANPGGMKIDGAENDVFSGGSDTANAKLAPRAENPDTKALRTASVPPRPQMEAPPTPPVPATNPPVVLSPPPTPVNKQVVSAPSVSKPAVVTSAPASPKPLPVKPAATAETHAPAAGRQTMVQLAALPTEEAARSEWQVLTKRMPDLLNGHQPNYTRTERDGRTFWRVRTSGFGDLAQAHSFCDHVRAKGGGCSVAEF